MGKRNEWPLVAKPTGGAGSDGVYFCKSLEDLRFAHSQIIGVYNPTGKMNSEIALQGPRLIELSTGISKATYAADVILGNGDLFHKLYQEERPGRYLYPRLKQCVQLVLISSSQGYLQTDIKEMLASLRLPSIVEIVPAVERGGFINASRDLATAAGTVLMVHESMEQIKADTAKIRELEESGKLYEVSQEPLQSSRPVTPARSRAVSLESQDGSQAGRIRLDSFEKMDALWAEMNRSAAK